MATEIARSLPETEAESKWKVLGDRALALWHFDLARESFEKAGDLSALMLLLLAIGDRTGLQALAKKAGMSPLFALAYLLTFGGLPVVEKGQNNLAFAVLLQLGDASPCVDLLLETQRAPEAALFARTYAPR